MFIIARIREEPALYAEGLLHARRGGVCIFVVGVSWLGKHAGVIPQESRVLGETICRDDPFLFLAFNCVGHLYCSDFNRYRMYTNLIAVRSENSRLR